MSFRIPTLWRNPGGCGEPPRPSETTEVGGWLARGIAAAEGIFRGLALGLGSESEGASTSAGPSVTGMSPATFEEITPDRVLESYMSMEKIPESDRAALWDRTIARLRESGVDCPPEYTATYAGFRASLDRLGPRTSSRVLRLESALELLHNRDSLGREPIERPIAVVIGPASDHNGAFTAGGGFPLLDRLLEDGSFHVIYFEGDDESDILSSLEEVRRLSGRRIHTAVFAGHGNPSMLALSGADPANPSEEFREADYVDANDFALGEFARLDDLLEPNGQILLASCSNGSGGAAAPFNLANSVSRAAPGRSVYSVREPGNLRSLEVSPDLTLEVEWNNDAPYVAYSADGAPPAIVSTQRSNANG